ncbi:uncharacterized protein LOC114759671 [Neltuma alba]|uniref:uncharacterized protein LOC114759671 n=1 Tax=Neltuma alba TaxID=207710 RepID=UPI0010A55978|nr:uncharacterized protein LOC114759671 [Prosopis alba]
MQLFGSSAAELRDEVCKDSEPGTFPEPLIKSVGKVIIVKLNLKDNNLNRPNSSISVSQLSDDPKIVEQFTYFYQPGGGPVISQSSPAESSGSKSSSKVHEAQTYEDNDLTISQFITPNYSQAKRRKELKSPSLEVENLGLSGMLTPDFSATKPTKTIKKEPK